MADRKGKSAKRRSSAPRTAGAIAGGIFKWFFGILGTVILMGVLTLAIMACYGSVFVRDVIMPQTSVELKNYTLGENSNIYYLDKETGDYVSMLELNDGSSQVWVSYNDMPQYLLDAAVAIEDQRFYQHQGVDWKRTAGAVLALATGSGSYGGSTITQQLIKNVTENDDVTVKRKVTEIFQALEFEKSHSKSEILEYYLNIIFLGERCNGVGAAAQAYFGKDVSQLSLAECASLVGITNNPSKYDPLLTSVITVKDENGNKVEMTHLEANKNRQTAILEKMEELGYITTEEKNAALAEELQFVDKSAESEDDTQRTYTWFEEALINEVKQDLLDAGYSEQGAKLMLYSGGLKIYSTFDPSVQAVVDEVYLDRSNFDYTSANGQQMQSAITIVDNETGAVVALSGSVGEKEENLLYNRATMAKRQPGSSLKPLAVYAPAIDCGMILPSSVYDDIPNSYDESTGKSWPRNSYGYYAGRMTMTEAVRRSSNAVAVNVLEDLTPQKSYDFLTQKLGFTTLVDSEETTSGMTLTDIALAPLGLGGLTVGTTTYQMAGAYSTFARDGVYVEPYTYSRIEGADGTVILENTGAGAQAVQASTAFYMTQMMEDVVQNGTGQAAQISGVPVAGKTGTTTRNFDRWFCGYTPYYTAAVWTGYDKNEDISSSTNVSTRVWQKIMSEIHQNLPEKEFSVPGETVTVTYCIDSGDLPTSACRSDARGGRTATGVFLVGDEPSERCSVHTTARVCTYSPISGTGMYRLAGSGVSSDYIRTIGVLDVDRDYDEIHDLPRDYMYTLSWLKAQGYASGSHAPVQQSTQTPAESEAPEESAPAEPPAESQTPASEPVADTGTDTGGEAAGGTTGG